MPAGNALVGGEAQLRQDIPVSGQRFDGTLPPKPNFDGADAELVVSVYSGSGETLGVWARRFITDTP